MSMKQQMVECAGSFRLGKKPWLFPSIAALMMIGAGVQAEPISLVSKDTPAAPSFFTLNFGGGLRSTGQITRTAIELTVDPDAGTASIANYDQDVAAFTLPGGINTGDLLIRVQPGSSAGTYNELTGVFETNEIYEIHFSTDPAESDLAMLGLTESPLLFPSHSTGTVTLSTAPSGKTKLDWAGSSTLPGTGAPFDYTCDVTSVFTPKARTLLRLDLTPDVINLVNNQTIENRLVAKLARAISFLDQGLQPWSVLTLRSFIDQVNVYSGNGIPSANAQSLVGSANDILFLLMFERPTPVTNTLSGFGGGSLTGR